MNKAKWAALFIVILMFAAGTAHSDEEKGRALFNDKGLGSNGKTCNTCHAGGRDIDGSKETFTILGSQQESIEDAVNFCIKMALNGAPLEKDSAKMKDLVSYLKTLKGKGQGRSETPGY